jgi:hypothetical protein
MSRDWIVVSRGFISLLILASFLVLPIGPALSLGNLAYAHPGHEGHEEIEHQYLGDTGDSLYNCFMGLEIPYVRQKNSVLYVLGAGLFAYASSVPGPIKETYLLALTVTVQLNPLYGKGKTRSNSDFSGSWKRSLMLSSPFFVGYMAHSASICWRY